MDIIAIRGTNTVSLRRFLKEWWALQGVLKKHRGWVFVFVTGKDYWGTVSQYAQLISSEMEKLVIYINGKSGVVNDFTIYERGVVCPASETPGTHESWLIGNRLSLWKVSKQNQESLRKILCEFSNDLSGPIIYLDTANTRLTRLAGALFGSWKLPLVWSANSVDELAKNEDCEVI